MAIPVYPKALSSWTNRIDEVDVIWAADPNTLAAEIISIEQTLGLMPQVEPSPPVGNPVTYESVSARITDSGSGNLHPYVHVTNKSFKIGRTGPFSGAFLNPFEAVSDDYKFFNGTDITIKASGIYIADHSQQFEPQNDGWVATLFVVNNNYLRIVKYDFVPVPRNITNYVSTEMHWMGDLIVGDRVRIATINATSKDPMTVTNSNLRIFYQRGLPAQADRR